MGAAENRAAFTAYAFDGDVSRLARDAVFTDVSSGQRHEGRQAVVAMLEWFYSEAFTAHAKVSAVMVDDSHACLEAEVIGRHTGEYAGVPATGKQIRVPMSVWYDFTDGKISAGRIYFAVPVFLAQVTDRP